jgi:hypothetical protein
LVKLKKPMTYSEKLKKKLHPIEKMSRVNSESISKDSYSSQVVVKSVGDVSGYRWYFDWSEDHCDV